MNYIVRKYKGALWLFDKHEAIGEIHPHLAVQPGDVFESYEARWCDRETKRPMFKYKKYDERYWYPDKFDKYVFVWID